MALTSVEVLACRLNEALAAWLGDTQFYGEPWVEIAETLANAIDYGCLTPLDSKRLNKLLSKT